MFAAISTWGEVFMDTEIDMRSASWCLWLLPFKIEKCWYKLQFICLVNSLSVLQEKRASVYLPCTLSAVYLSSKKREPQFISLAHCQQFISPSRKESFSLSPLHIVSSLSESFSLSPLVIVSSLSLLQGKRALVNLPWSLQGKRLTGAQ